MLVVAEADQLLVAAVRGGVGQAEGGDPVSGRLDLQVVTGRVNDRLGRALVVVLEGDPLARAVGDLLQQGDAVAVTTRGCEVLRQPMTVSEPWRTIHRSTWGVALGCR